MVMSEKHLNVLQYKESKLEEMKKSETFDYICRFIIAYCFPMANKKHHTLREVCLEINGDASLFSLFRRKS